MGRGIDRAAVEQITELLQAAETLQAELGETVRLYWLALAALEQGAEMATLLRSSRDRSRRRLVEAVDGFLRVRHKLVLLNVRAALEDGMRTAEIAEAYGVSRQLVNRWIRETGWQRPRRERR